MTCGNPMADDDCFRQLFGPSTFLLTQIRVESSGREGSDDLGYSLFWERDAGWLPLQLACALLVGCGGGTKRDKVGNKEDDPYAWRP